MALPTLLVIDDDLLVRRAVDRTLTAQGYRVLTAGDGEDAISQLQREEIDVALVDLGLPGMDGLTLLREARRLSPATECIVITGQADVSSAYSSLDAGASDYFEKPIRDWQRFQQVLRRATEVRRLKREKAQLEERVGAASRLLVGHSAPMEQLRHLIRSVARSSASILVIGESGVGKELVAESIHRESGRGGQYVQINCASMPKDLIEGELFGWEKGAHSTATQPKPGLFEVAEGGTVLLDEIGDMPIELQAKLLRVLESRRYRRLGGTVEKTMDVRIVAATNAELERAIAEGRFRQDLYFRLNVVTIPVPPLRERRDDIAILAYHFVRSFNEQESRNVRRVPPEMLARLERHDWPGNVRELRNVLYRAVLLSEGEELDPASLHGAIGEEQAGFEEALARPDRPDPSVEDLFALDFAEAKKAVVADFTQRYLEHCLARSGGNITRAAEMSGMLRPNFRRLMKQFDVEVPSGND